MQTEQENLTTWQKIGYGLGDIYGGGSGVVISFYYLIFLTDIRRISQLLAGTVILISKVYDSIMDPLEGALIEPFKNRALVYTLRMYLFSFALYFAARYPPTPELHNRLNKYLAVVRKGEKPAEDGEHLKKILVG